MRKILMFIGGLITGLGTGIGIATLIAPMSGKELADEAQARLEALKEEARRASEARKAQLAEQLNDMTEGAVSVDLSKPDEAVEKPAG